MEGTCGPSVRAGTRASKDPRHGLLEAFAAAAGARATSSSEVISQPRAKRGIMVNRTICALALIVMAPITLAATAGPKSFASPEAGIAALVEAVKVDDQPMLHGILGSHGSKLTSSGDAVADRQNRETFLKAYGEAHKLVLEGNTKATLVIGQDEWPMPIPLVKSDGGWRFDTQQGEKEILARRIGRNEMAAIQVCLAIVDAEREYATLDLDSDGIPEYAPKFVSAPGKRDGLYWQTKTDDPLSPLGPLLATATQEGYTRSASRPLAPYHGYFYRILTRQGKDAPGGAYDYFVNGKMIGGFAVIAYPARYGASGVMSFIVNHDGVVYEKDLGKNTAAIASKMTTFNPDASWKRP